MSFKTWTIARRIVQLLMIALLASPLAGLTVAVEKHMTPVPPRRVARLVLRFAMPAGLAAAQRVKLEAAARACPVALSVSPEVATEIAFAYPD